MSKRLLMVILYLLYIVRQRKLIELKQLQTPQAASAGEPFLMPGALELPQSRRVQWQGRNAQGQAVYADALWFVRLEGAKARAYQALVLSAQPVPSAVRDTFVQGLQAR